MDIPAPLCITPSLSQGKYTLTGKMFSLYPVGVSLAAICGHYLLSFLVHLSEESGPFISRASLKTADLLLQLHFSRHPEDICLIAKSQGVSKRWT